MKNNNYRAHNDVLATWAFEITKDYKKAAELLNSLEIKLKLKNGSLRWNKLSVVRYHIPS